MTQITIISGFLGAGKTTFANRLLDYLIRRGEKTVFVVNEFGETGLDSALLSQKGFQTLDIDGGCICCTLRGKVTQALEEVIRLYEPTWIVFEPSGVFIFEQFETVLGDPVLRGSCAVDSVVTIVDSLHVKDTMLIPGNFFTNQIAHADTLIVSKLESFQGEAETLTRRLRELNPDAALIAKPWSHLTDADFAALVRGGSKGLTNDDGLTHGHAELDSFTIRADIADDTVLQERTRLLREGYYGDVYRIKGSIRIAGKARLLQAAFSTVELAPDTPPGGEDGLTFIGHGLREDRIVEDWVE